MNWITRAWYWLLDLWPWHRRSPVYSFLSDDDSEGEDW